MELLINSFREALEAVDRVSADRIFKEALTGMTPIQAVEQIVVPALEQVGEAWIWGWALCFLVLPLSVVRSVICEIVKGS